MGCPHRRLLPLKVNINCSQESVRCCTSLPPSPPPPVTISIDGGTTSHKAQHLTVLALAVSSAVAACLLFLTYYLLLLRLRAHFRRRSPSHNPTTTTTTPLNAEEEEEQAAPTHEGPDHGNNNNNSFHHVWYIRTVGLDEATIASIAVRAYKAGAGLVDCSVCLTEFEEGELVKLLPKCNHAFHVSCIDTWLRAHVNCPLCRAPVVSPPHPQQQQQEEEEEEEEEEAPTGSSFVGGDAAVPAPIEVGVSENGVGSFSNLGSSSSSSSTSSPSPSSSLPSSSSGVGDGVVESGIVGQTDPVGSESGEEHWVTIDLNEDDDGNDGGPQQHIRRSVSTDALPVAELMNVDGGGPAAEKGPTVAAVLKGEGGGVDRCQSANGRRFFLPRFARGRSSSAVLPL